MAKERFRTRCPFCKECVARFVHPDATVVDYFTLEGGTGRTGASVIYAADQRASAVVLPVLGPVDVRAVDGLSDRIDLRDEAMLGVLARCGCRDGRSVLFYDSAEDLRRRSREPGRDSSTRATPMYRITR